MSTAYKLVHGKRACQCQVDSLPMIEARLRAIGAITTDLSGLITQGAYNPASVDASAGTHDKGGVWDVKASLVDTAEKRRVWRESGVAMWHRTPDQGKWPAHGHGVWIGCPHLQGAAGTDGKTWVHGALKQVDYYRQGLNGLSNKAPDQGPTVPYITWQQALTAWRRTPEGFIATMDEKQLRRIIREEAAAAVKADRERPAIPGHKEEWGATPNDLVPRTAYRVGVLDAWMRKIAAKLGIEDEG